MIYDSNGATFSLYGSGLYDGSYTVLVIGKEAYPVVASAATLTETKNELDEAGNNLYLEKTVNVEKNSDYTQQFCKGCRLRGADEAGYDHPDHAACDSLPRLV